jgi:hypothetical protein
MLTVFVGLEEQTTLDSKCKISSGGISAGKSTVSTEAETPTRGLLLFKLGMRNRERETVWEGN